MAIIALIKKIKDAVLLEFMTAHQLFVINSFVDKKKQRKWTWMSPDTNMKNKINYIRLSDKTIVQDVTTLNTFNLNSDHRFV